MGLKITIVTICYNAEKLIENTLKSVVSQDYFDVEYIVIDGGSTDSTCKIISNYIKNISFFISESDHGISDAFNKGIKKASGDVICFLNAGDYFVSSHILSDVAKDLQENEVDVLFYRQNVGNEFLSPQDKYNNDSEKIWNKLEIPHQACFCKRTLFEKIGDFNRFVRIRMDYDFFARCVKYGASYKYINKVISYYDFSGVSANKKNRVRFYEEALAINLLYDLPISWKEIFHVVEWRIRSKLNI